MSTTEMLTPVLPSLPTRAGPPALGRAPRRGAALAVLLFGATFLLTTYGGYACAVAPPTALWSAGLFRQALASPSLLLLGLPFSLSLLSILLAHEMGHLIACLRHGVDASPPYFIPAPTLIGTLGAFIRVRVPLAERHVLFDVGAAGPLAGFVLTLAYLALGVLTARPGSLSGALPDFGVPLVFEWALRLRFGTVPSPLSLTDNPVLFAAWVGCLLTALNLLPVGQLDGGHVLHALVGRWSRPIAFACFAGLLVLFVTTWWPGWLLWSVLLLCVGLRHPSLADTRPLSRGRQALGVLCFIILAICFMPHPIRVS